MTNFEHGFNPTEADHDSEVVDLNLRPEDIDSDIVDLNLTGAEHNLSAESPEAQLVREDATQQINEIIEEVIVGLNLQGNKIANAKIHDIFDKSLLADSRDLIASGMDMNFTSDVRLTTKNELASEAVEAMKRGEVDPMSSNYDTQLKQFLYPRIRAKIDAGLKNSLN